MPIINSSIHIIGVIYIVPQNIFESNALISAMSSNDSNIHSFDPSSRTYDHHRSPTNNLPDMFFTVQKSKAKNIMHNTKVKIKFCVIYDPNIYNSNARNLNNKWKKTAVGCYKNIIKEMNVNLLKNIAYTLDWLSKQLKIFPNASELTLPSLL